MFMNILEGPMLSPVVRQQYDLGDHGVCVVKRSGELWTQTGRGYLLTSDCVPQGRPTCLLSLDFPNHKWSSED